MTDTKDTLSAPGSMRERMARAAFEAVLFRAPADFPPIPWDGEPGVREDWLTAIDAALEEMRGLPVSALEKAEAAMEDLALGEGVRLSYYSKDFSDHRGFVSAVIDSIKGEAPGAGGEG